MQAVATLKARTTIAGALGAFLVLQFLDLATTGFILLNGGIELNPLGAWSYAQLGLTGLVIIKVIGLGALYALMHGLHNYLLRYDAKLLPLSYGLQMGVLFGGIGWFGFVVLRNVALYGGMA